jgi:hypothetical protein
MNMERIRKPDQRDGWYRFTPASAQITLDGGAKNRRRREFRSQRIAADVTAGFWRENGESLIFDEKGKLMDGQTRLRACVIADKPIVAYCVFGVPYKFFPSLDQCAPRSGSDLSGLLGFAHENCVSAVAKLGILYAEKKITTTGKSQQIGNDRLRIYLDRNHDRLITAVSAAQTRRKGIVKLLPISLAAFVHYMVAKNHPDKVEEFLDKLSSGENLRKGDALLLLRERMKDLAGQKHILLRSDKLALLIKAWNSFLAGTTVKVLKWNGDVEQFPVFSGADVSGDQR